MPDGTVVGVGVEVGVGVDLVYRSDGSLQLGVNQWPDYSAARSTAGKITTDSAAGSGNWKFFAVTYDSTLSTGQVKYYFGTPAADPVLDSTINYGQGIVGTNIGPNMTVGHFNTASRSGAQDRMFRGLIDQIRVYGSTADSSGALTLAQIVSVKKEFR